MASNEALYKENIRLQDELTQEKLRYLELAILKDNLRKYEGFSSDGVTPLIFAKRIGGIDTFVYDAFRIDKGNASGVQGGELIVGLSNTVVGVVSEVGEKTSHVSLLWNGDEFLGRTSVDGTVITLSGTDDGVYKALVPHEMVFQIGDVVLYDRNPKLIVGVVKKINNNEEDRFKEIIVHVPFHPRMIDIVRVESSL
ncbi:MAG: rod shape-determining protein MreC [Minisyncoccia bacterium]